MQKVDSMLIRVYDDECGYNPVEVNSRLQDAGGNYYFPFCKTKLKNGLAQIFVLDVDRKDVCPQCGLMIDNNHQRCNVCNRNE